MKASGCWKRASPHPPLPPHQSCHVLVQGCDFWEGHILLATQRHLSGKYLPIILFWFTHRCCMTNNNSQNHDHLYSFFKIYAEPIQFTLNHYLLFFQDYGKSVPSQPWLPTIYYWHSHHLKSFNTQVGHITPWWKLACGFFPHGQSAPKFSMTI